MQVKIENVQRTNSVHWKPITYVSICSN